MMLVLGHALANTYDEPMSAVKMRAEIKKAVDRLPAERLASLADYVGFLTRPSVAERVATAERAVAKGKAVNWRKVRSDV
jgi:hypothetical protein